MMRRHRGQRPNGAEDHPAARTCHWPGCERQIPPHYWACTEHWAALLKRLREHVARAYRPRQEIDKQPSREYIQTAQEVHHWMLEHDIR